MISRHISIEPGNDNYGRLAHYIARLGDHAEEAGQPALIWCAGCVGGDDYAEAIAEVRDTQALNTRTASNKTYHLVVSFRPEDEAKLMPEVFKAIEMRFAEALGLAEHQRHWAVHTDTQNVHIQIAYNLIHPETLTRNDHSWDYAKRDALCRKLEREYGLAVDNGMDLENPDQRNEKAVALEAQQGRQSFDGYAKEHKETILQALKSASTWQDLHTALALRGMEIKIRGNGFVIKNKHGKEAIKASDLDRRLSKPRLEKTFGVFQAAHSAAAKKLPEQSRYQRRPLQQGSLSEKLFAEYQLEAADRKESLTSLREDQAATLAAIREKWRLERVRLEKLNILKHNRRNLLQLARRKEAAELAAAKAEQHQERDALARERPYRSWNDFLCRSAANGNEQALKLLRSGSKSAGMEAPKPGYTAFAAQKAEFAEKQVRVLASGDLTRKGKTRLSACLRMEESLLEEKQRGGLPEESLTHRVDKKGDVIFTLSSGGRIRDSGREVFFSSENSAAKSLALLYARKKWGRHLLLDGGRSCFDREAFERERQRAVQKNKGLSR